MGFIYAENKIKDINICKDPNKLRGHYEEENRVTVLRALAENKYTPSDILEKLLKNKDSKIRSSVAENPNTSDKTLNKLLNENNLEIKYIIFNRESNSNEIKNKLSKYNKLFNNKDFYSIKNNINQITYTDILEELSKDEDYSIREAVAENPNTPTNILEKLSNDEDYRVRKAVAENPNTPTNILEKLSKDKSITVKSYVAKNPNTPVNILKELSKYNNKNIKIGIAKNPNTPTNILEKLSRDEDYLVRRRVARNSNTPTNILEKLSNDEDYSVREAVAENPNTSDNILEKLSNDKNYRVRKAIAENPNTPDNILEKLSRDEDYFIRRRVAENPNTPDNILEKLSNDEDYSVREAVAENPNTPDNILEKLSKDKDYSIREAVAENPNTPDNILEKLSNDGYYSVREAVAENPNTPDNILEKLSNDEDEDIRKAAQDNLNKRKNKLIKSIAQEIIEEDMPRNYYIYKNLNENDKIILNENDFLLKMDENNCIINSYKYEKNKLINLSDGVKTINKEFLINYFYQHKKILNFNENLLEITRGQFFYLQELLTRKVKDIKSNFKLTSPENIIFYGPPGTGKTYGFRKKALEIICKDEIKDDKVAEKYKELLKNNRINFTTFHPDYSYEAFIEGIKPKTDENGNVSYEIEDGAFLKICKDALLKGLSESEYNEFNEFKNSKKNIFDFFLEQNSDIQEKIYEKAGNFVFIIDEINRGNLPRIFGELITLMEADKRLGAEEQIILKLPYSQKTFSIPKNIHILASMNTADKSIAAIDTALRRRFRFIEVMPNPELLKNIVIKGINVEKLLRKINKNVEIYHDREHTIGHAYFMKLTKNPNFDLLCDIMEFQVIPLLQEYFYEDWGKVKAVLNNSDLIKENGERVINNDNFGGEKIKIYEVNSALKNRDKNKLIELFKAIYE